MWKKKKIKLENDTCQVSTLDDNCLYFSSFCVCVRAVISVMSDSLWPCEW